MFNKPKNIVSIVDDDESVREAMKRLVTSLGYYAATFSSAEEFLNSDHLNDTSCLITDVQMPGLSGIDLQQHLNQQGRRIPIIFVTADPEHRLRTHAIEAGAVEYFSKPFNCDQLVMCLERALRSKD